LAINISLFNSFLILGPGCSGE